MFFSVDIIITLGDIPNIYGVSVSQGFKVSLDIFRSVFRSLASDERSLLTNGYTIRQRSA